MGVTIAKVLESRILDAYYITYIIIGIWFCLKSMMTFPFNPFSPKITINQTKIILKKNVFKRAVVLNWGDLKSIQFDRFRILFRLMGAEFIFDYKSNEAVSIEIENAFNAMAKAKGIEIEIEKKLR